MPPVRRIVDRPRMPSGPRSSSPVELLGLVDLEGEGRASRRRRAGRCVASVFAMISLANELFSSSVRKLQARGALQVVEAVAVLQLLELGLEHEVEGRAQHAAERHLLLGEAADPEVDVVETGAWSRRPAHAGPGAGAVQEVEPVGARSSPSAAERPAMSVSGRGALVRERRRAR